MINSILLLCPLHCGGALSMIGGQLFALAIDEAGLNKEDVSVAGVLTSDVDHGRDSVKAFSSEHDISGIIAFGKTTASVDLPDMPDMETARCMVEGQVLPVNVLRLPSLLSSWWHDPHNSLEAIHEIAGFISLGQGEADEPPVLAWGTNRWN